MQVQVLHIKVGWVEQVVVGLSVDLQRQSFY